MEIEIGGGSARRRRLSDDGRDAWTGLTLGAVLDNNKRPPVQVNRTLLDIIRDEEPNNSGAYKNLINHHNNKKSWKSFKDRISLRRAGNAWTPSMHTPMSDTFSYQDGRSPSQLSRRDSTRMSGSVNNGDLVEDNAPRPQMSRMMSGRATQTPIVTEPDDPIPESETVRVNDVHVSFQNNRSSMLRRNSSRLPGYQTQADPFNEPEATPGVRLSVALAAEREQIQRVVSSSMSEPTIEPELENTVGIDQEEEVSTSTSALAPAPVAAPAPPVRMSLMDLLEETDREMGWGAYNDEDEEEYEDEEDEAEKQEEEKGKGEGGKEFNCCVCMVRHKGAAFIPCGHTFCRLCSRELLVARGNCPICNGYTLEILDIF